LNYEQTVPSERLQDKRVDHSTILKSSNIRDDFAMLRPVLLALLPQVGGLMPMVARGAR
jgi:hypothetical protein